MSTPVFAPHFPLSELRCKCGCEPPPHVVRNLARLSWALERIRERVGRPITVISGHRCDAHNAAIGGASRSRHTTGEGGDVKSRGYTGEDLREIAEEEIAAGNIPQGGLGTYRRKPATLHYDTRGYRARWRK